MRSDPMSRELRRLAALEGLGSLDADTMRTAVDRLMDEGFYADTCLDALSSKPARRDEVLPAFRDALAHAGLTVPRPDDAIWVLIDHHVRRIAEPDGDPWLGLKDLIREVYWDEHFNMNSTQEVGGSHGVQELIGWYWSLDDLAGVQGKPFETFVPSAPHRDAIRQAARIWLARYGAEAARRWTPWAGTEAQRG
jgi:hypothetical protein